MGPACAPAALPASYTPAFACLFLRAAPYMPLPGLREYNTCCTTPLTSLHRTLPAACMHNAHWVGRTDTPLLTTSACRRRLKRTRTALTARLPRLQWQHYPFKHLVSACACLPAGTACQQTHRCLHCLPAAPGTWEDYLPGGDCRLPRGRVHLHLWVPKTGTACGGSHHLPHLTPLPLQTPATAACLPMGQDETYLRTAAAFLPLAGTILCLGFYRSYTHHSLCKCL